MQTGPLCFCIPTSAIIFPTASQQTTKQEIQSVLETCAIPAYHFLLKPVHMLDNSLQYILPDFPK